MDSTLTMEMEKELARQVESWLNEEEELEGEVPPSTSQVDELVTRTLSPCAEIRS